MSTPLIDKLFPAGPNLQKLLRKVTDVEAFTGSVPFVPDAVNVEEYSPKLNVPTMFVKATETVCVEDAEILKGVEVKRDKEADALPETIGFGLNDKELIVTFSFPELNETLV